MCGIVHSPVAIRAKAGWASVEIKSSCFGAVSLAFARMPRAEARGASLYFHVGRAHGRLWLPYLRVCHPHGFPCSVIVDSTDSVGTLILDKIFCFTSSFCVVFIFLLLLVVGVYKKH